MRAWVFYEQVKPLKAIAARRTRTPILFSHGEQDDFYSTQVRIEMYKF